MSSFDFTLIIFRYRILLSLSDQVRIAVLITAQPKCGKEQPKYQTNQGTKA
jgi:hypothetical protein